MDEKKTLVLFDFDGTLTFKDSLFDFLLYSNSKYQFWKNMVINLPTLISFKLGYVDNQTAKEKLLASFYKNYTKQDLALLGYEYGKNRIRSTLRTEAVKSLKKHITKGHRIIVISASPEFWLKAWCKSAGIELIGTKLEFKQNVFTGKFSGKTCYGQEKVDRLKQLLSAQQLASYNVIYAYGDSAGDKEMLALANHPHYKPFR